MEAVRIGNAYAWVIKPNPDDETAMAFGLTDEAAKIDINKAGSSDMLPNLPNITQENIDCLIDWRSTYDSQSPQKRR